MNHTMHGIIFSYGKPTGLGDLIAHRIPGSMPFGGNYRVVDFMLSSMVNAGIHDVGVIMHGKCQSMLDHLGNGRSWDLSRNRGGLTLLPAFAYAESRTSAGRFRGKVEALGCVLEYLREIRQEYVVLADSDLVVNLPLEQVLQEHIASGADLTEVCTAEPGDPSDTYLEMDEQGRIVDVAYDVHTPAGYRCLNVCILRRELLVQLVEECAGPQPVQLPPPHFTGSEGSAASARLCVAGVCRPHRYGTDLLPPQHGTAGPGAAAAAVRSPATHSGQGERCASGVSGPCRGVRELPHCRWLRYSGQREKLHSVPGCPGREGSAGGELRAL